MTKTFNLFLCFSACLLIGCSRKQSISPVTPERHNSSPQIRWIDISPSSPTPGSEVQLTCYATDPDNDSLSYTWSVSIGTITNPNSNTTKWQIPSDAVPNQHYSVKLIVSDSRLATDSSRQIVIAFAQGYDPRLKWKYNTGKFVYYSSPAIGSDGTIYVGNGISGGGTGLFAINPDGNQKWIFPMSNPVFTPSIASDGIIYVQDFTSTLYAINSNGTERWKYILNSTTGIGQTSPAIDLDGTIYICASGIYAIKPDGSLKWHYNDPFMPAANIRTSPSLSPDSCIIIATSDRPISIWKLNSNGSRVWKCNLPEGDFIFSSPGIASDGTIYVGAESQAGEDKSFLYAIRPDSTLKWKYTITGGRPIRSSPSIDANGTIYIGTKAGSSPSAQLLALNPDGTLKWSYTIQQIHGADDIYCSPTIGSDWVIYFGAENGLLHALNPDGTLNWTFDTNDGMNWSSPAIANDGTIYFGCGDGNLYALKSNSLGLGNSHWPKFRYNNQNTGRTY